MTTRHVAVAGAIVAIAAGLALGGCRGGGAHPAGSSSPTAMSQAQLLALGHEYAQCIRQHGIPDFPDPVFRNGRLMMPAGDTTSKQKLTNNLGAQNACRSLAARLPQSGNHESQAPLSQAEVHKLMQWVQCMRQHGVQVADPDQYGNFRNMPDKRTAGVLAALEACTKFRPDGGK
jgi:hypothetical protein